MMSVLAEPLQGLEVGLAVLLHAADDRVVVALLAGLLPLPGVPVGLPPVAPVDVRLHVLAAEVLERRDELAVERVADLATLGLLGLLEHRDVGVDELRVRLILRRADGGDGDGLALVLERLATGGDGLLAVEPAERAHREVADVLFPVALGGLDDRARVLDRGHAVDQLVDEADDGQVQGAIDQQLGALVAVEGGGRLERVERAGLVPLLERGVHLLLDVAGVRADGRARRLQREDGSESQSDRNSSPARHGVSCRECS